MTWFEIQVGDVLEHDGDLLLVLKASRHLIRVVALDVRSQLDEASPGAIEDWARTEDGWDSGENMVKSATLVWRDESVFPSTSR